MSDETILDGPEGQKEKKGDKLHSYSEISAFKADVRQFAQDAVDEGKDKNETVNHLIHKYGNRYEKMIVQTVGFSISSEQRKYYQNHLRLLIVLQFAMIFFLILTAHRYYQASMDIKPALALFVMMGLIEGLILNRLLKFEGTILKTVILINGIKLFSVYDEVYHNFYGQWGYLYMLVMVFALVFAFYFRRKLYPNISFWGPRKDEFGNYKF